MYFVDAHIVHCKRLMHSPGLHSILQQVHGICVLTREFGHSIVGSLAYGLLTATALGKLPLI